MTQLGRINQPQDTQCLSGWDMWKVSSRLYYKFGRNSENKIFSYPEGCFGGKVCAWWDVHYSPFCFITYRKCKVQQPGSSGRTSYLGWQRCLFSASQVQSQAASSTVQPLWPSLSCGGWQHRHHCWEVSQCRTSRCQAQPLAALQYPSCLGTRPWCSHRCFLIRKKKKLHFSFPTPHLCYLFIAKFFAVFATAFRSDNA